MGFIRLAIMIAMFHTSSTLAYKKCSCTGDPNNDSLLAEGNYECCTEETYYGTYISYNSRNELCSSPDNRILNTFPICCTEYGLQNSCTWSAHLDGNLNPYVHCVFIPWLSFRTPSWIDKSNQTGLFTTFLLFISNGCSYFFLPNVRQSIKLRYEWTTSWNEEIKECNAKASSLRNPRRTNVRYSSRWEQVTQNERNQCKIKITRRVSSSSQYIAIRNIVEKRKEGPRGKTN